MNTVLSTSNSGKSKKNIELQVKKKKKNLISIFCVAENTVDVKAVSHGCKNRPLAIVVTAAYDVNTLPTACNAIQNFFQSYN